jgi:hypothetical protein
MAIEIQGRWPKGIPLNVDTTGFTEYGLLPYSLSEIALVSTKIKGPYMANWVLIAEAVDHSTYTHEHIAWLVRNHRVAGKKVGGTWMVDLDELNRYEAEMAKQGTKKHTPKSSV